MEGVVNVEFHNSVITELIMRPSHSSTKPVWHATGAAAGVAMGVGIAGLAALARHLKQ